MNTRDFFLTWAGTFWFSFILSLGISVVLKGEVTHDDFVAVLLFCLVGSITSAGFLSLEKNK
jgi:hypothetical protein